MNLRASIKSVCAVWRICCISLPVAAAAADSPLEIRLGTIAPTGTSYHRNLQEMGERWRKATAGAVKLTIYPDGRQGGESAMVRKMRAGQLNAAALSAVGLSEIDPSVCGLQLMPMMFRSWEEVDYVREKIRPQLEGRLRDKGFVVLFWCDAGWVRYFSKEAAVHPDEFKRMKIFTWAGDPDQEQVMKRLGYKPVPLETADIHTGLQSGMINVVLTPPFFALAAQFDRSVPHMLEMNWVPIIAAVVMKRETWAKLPPASLKAIEQAAAEAGANIRNQSRQEDEKAVTAMKQRGLKTHPLTAESEAAWQELAEKAYPMIRGKQVPADVFDEVRRLVAESRNTPTTRAQ